MHTYALGWGKDMVASSVLLLMQMGVWGWARKIDTRLGVAFRDFRVYCQDVGKSTSLTGFSLKTFKVSSWPAYKINNSQLF